MAADIFQVGHMHPVLQAQAIQSCQWQMPQPSTLMEAQECGCCIGCCKPSQMYHQLLLSLCLPACCTSLITSQPRETVPALSVGTGHLSYETVACSTFRQGRQRLSCFLMVMQCCITILLLNSQFQLHKHCHSSWPGQADFAAYLQLLSSKHERLL